MSQTEQAVEMDTNLMYLFLSRYVLSPGKTGFNPLLDSLEKADAGDLKSDSF